ncbi:hypothetical protein AMTRI_Chr08g168140 [Amborella trichopoda]
MKPFWLALRKNISERCGSLVGIHKCNLYYLFLFSRFFSFFIFNGECIFANCYCFLQPLRLLSRIFFVISVSGSLWEMPIFSYNKLNYFVNNFLGLICWSKT